MHIVLVCREYVGSIRSGGIGSYMEEIAKAYLDIGHKVTIVTASDDTRKEYEYVSSDGIKIIYLSGGDFVVEKYESWKYKKLRCIYRFISYRKKIRQVLKSIPDIDIVEVADYGAEALFISDINVPVVIRLHTPQSLSISNLEVVRPKWWQIHRIMPIRAEKKILEQARYITACSNAVLNWVAEHFDISYAYTEVINNPISRPSNIQIKKKDTYNAEKVIFYAGTICETKGVGDLVDACNILRTHGVSIRLKLAGKGGSYLTALQKRAENNKWTWIEFLGTLSRDKVYENYVNADVCCFPSWWENMPMVCLESMALGAIVVSTDSGGTSEIITDGYNGFLTSRQNPESLFKTLSRVLCLDEDERLNISINAVNTIQERFSTKVIANKMLNYFQAVKNEFSEEIRN